MSCWMFTAALEPWQEVQIVYSAFRLPRESAICLGWVVSTAPPRTALTA